MSVWLTRRGRAIETAPSRLAVRCPRGSRTAAKAAVRLLPTRLCLVLDLDDVLRMSRHIGQKKRPGLAASPPIPAATALRAAIGLVAGLRQVRIRST